MTEMPLGAKLTYHDSNAIFEVDLDMELNKDLFKPIEKTQTIFKD
jgi:hypothetical protein